MTSTSASSSEINIRHAEFKDVESICKMLKDTFTITFGHTVPGEDLNIFLRDTYSTQAINAELMDPAMTSLVAEDPSQPENIIGFAQLLRGSSDKEPCMKDTEKAVEMHRMYVDKSFHRRGIGSRFMKELERIAKDEGFLVMWLG
ncbi:putative acyl- n-acyltransferase protein, partial [Erysiphe neolycopersici]